MVAWGVGGNAVMLSMMLLYYVQVLSLPMQLVVSTVRLPCPGGPDKPGVPPPYRLFSLDLRVCV